MKRRLACFIDGFNLYHAIVDLKEEYLKWVNLWKLAQIFKSKDDELVDVKYFSAYAYHRKHGEAQRHRQYVKALRFYGVTPIMGRFKPKDCDCKRCGRVWITHEEKESDVNIGIHMMDGAHRKEFDKAFLISADSDLVPVVRMIRDRFPSIQIKVISPPERRHSKEMTKAVPKRAALKRVHLRRCLLPDKIVDDEGKVIAIRPSKYDPP